MRTIAKDSGMSADARSTGIESTQAALNRLERQDWYRWSTVLLIAIILVAGLWMFVRPRAGVDIFEQDNMERGVIGVLGLVLLFAVFAIYQQLVINRLRRRLAGQIAMTATLELLTPPAVPEPEPGGERRQVQRFHFDQLLKVQTTAHGKETVLYGRTADLSNTGVGAVLPVSLPAGTDALLEFRTASDKPQLSLSATVRHQRGFHHGFEFLAISPAQLDEIRQACSGALPFADVYAR